MSIDDTPPNVTALFDQQRATQKNEDKMPDGVIAQIRIRRADMGDNYDAMVASFVVDTESLRESAALLITLEEVVRTFSSDLARKLSQLSMQGSDGLMEMVSIVQMIVDAHNTRASEVKHFHHDDEPLS